MTDELTLNDSKNAIASLMKSMQPVSRSGEKGGPVCGWWKVECCMLEHRKACCCTQYFLLYMKKPCATSTPRKLSGKVFADLPFDVKALRNDNGLSFLASNP